MPSQRMAKSERIVFELMSWVQCAAIDMDVQSEEPGGADTLYEEWEDWAVDHIFDELNALKTKDEFLTAVLELHERLPGDSDSFLHAAESQCQMRFER